MPENLADLAKNGDKAALENLLKSVRDMIYNLALRMLWKPADAEDATQEILIKIITHLESFRNESKFSTWAYQIASNHLLTFKKRFEKQRIVSLELNKSGLEQNYHFAEPFYIPDHDRDILAKEVKIYCTQAILLCLDRNHRLAYILGAIFGVKSEEGGVILGITPVNFRQRLSRSRKKILNFMEKRCGLVNESAACRCEDKIEFAVKQKRINPGKLMFADKPVMRRNLSAFCSEIREMDSAVAVFREIPYYTAPEKIMPGIESIF